MSTLDDAVDSIVVFHQLLPDRTHQFHIHWRAINDELGCYVRGFHESDLYAVTSPTLARVGMSMQALTGNSDDNGTDPVVILNFQREHLGKKIITTLSLVPEPTVVMTLPGQTEGFPIPVSKRYFSHEPQDWL